jgi:hypothetical protein
MGLVYVLIFAQHFIGLLTDTARLDRRLGVPAGT